MHATRYDRVGGSYSQFGPSDPLALIADLAGRIKCLADASLVLDIGSGTGAFTRRLRAALPSRIRLIEGEPSLTMRRQATAETPPGAGIWLVAGTAEATPFATGSAAAIVAATAAHWFDRSIFYGGEAPRIVPVRRAGDRRICPRREGKPVGGGASRLYGRARLPASLYAARLSRGFEREPGLGEFGRFELRQELRIGLDEFVGLALSSSHAAGVVERYGEEGTRARLRDLALPYRIDAGHVPFGYLFQCFTAQRSR